MLTTKTFKFERRLSGNAQAVWDTLAAIGGVDEWLPIITSCRVDGEGDGARRTCETADGSVLEERITGVDHDRRRLEYEVYEGLPVTDYSGAFEIVDDGDVQRLVWTVEAGGEPEALEQITAMLEQVVPMAFDGLEATAREVVGPSE